ncbi:hypothetical protein AYK26_06965 [Euryarchaeota archaeon SM23-78]|nr:MAG: hypothetical protein AYK26_06965 [Euryarchaeota archaeon SM23-78]
MIDKTKIGMNYTLTWQQLKTNFPNSLPHYKKKEVETIKRFVQLSILPGTYSFDVRLPYELTDREKNLPEPEQKMMISLKSMRIDAIIETNNEIWIIEVCKGLELSYTGKILGYTDLYKTIFKPNKPVKMGVVGIDDNVLARRALENMGIKIWLVSI